MLILKYYETRKVKEENCEFGGRKLLLHTGKAIDFDTGEVDNRVFTCPIEVSDSARINTITQCISCMDSEYRKHFFFGMKVAT